MTSAAKQPYTWWISHSCSFAEDGADGLGQFSIEAHAYEWGSTKVSRFNLNYRIQVYGKSWSGIGPEKWITVSEHDYAVNTDNYPDSYTTYLYAPKWTSSWGPNSATQGPWRLQLRGKWIDRGRIDKVKLDTHWVMICQGQPTLAGGNGIYQ